MRGRARAKFASTMPDNATNAESWRHAYGGCKQILTTLAQASDEDGRLAARTWWRTGAWRRAQRNVKQTTTSGGPRPPNNSLAS